MKKYIFLVLLLFPLILSAQQKASIGMGLDEVKKLYPGMRQSQYENQITLIHPDTLYGLTSEWGYRFENNKLDWIYFSKYIDTLNETNFNKCLAATMHLIADYSMEFGAPDTLIPGTLHFRDPYTDHHWGYDVIEARWNDANGMKIKIEFTFMGGKGEYHLIVIVNYFDKNYPYFE